VGNSLPRRRARCVLRSRAGQEPLIPRAYEVLRWPIQVLGQFALAPAEVAAYGQPLELRPAYLSFRTAASVVAHTSTVAYPRRITTPGGAELLAWAGEGAPILSDRQVQELLETDLSEEQCSQLDAIPPLLWGRLRGAAEMAFALRVSVALLGIALPAEVQARAAHLAGLGARIRPALCRMLLTEVLATGTGAPQRLAVRAQIIHAQTVRRVVSSTAPEGSYTLGHLSHYQGGRDSAGALRSVVGADTDIGGRFGPAGPLSLGSASRRCRGGRRVRRGGGSRG
jgi:hypothetical protein